MLKWINKKKNRKGFTLVELVVVIAILGILAAIAVPRLGGFKNQAKQAADKQAAAVIAKAVELYNASNNITTDTAPSPKTLYDADLIDAKALVPQFNPDTNKGYNVVVSNGKATVSYASTASGETATGWGTVIANTVLFPQ